MDPAEVMGILKMQNGIQVQSFSIKTLCNKQQNHKKYHKRFVSADPQENSVKNK